MQLNVVRWTTLLWQLYNNDRHALQLNSLPFIVWTSYTAFNYHFGHFVFETNTKYSVFNQMNNFFSFFHYFIADEYSTTVRQRLLFFGFYLFEKSICFINSDNFTHFSTLGTILDSLVSSHSSDLYHLFSWNIYLV